MCSSPASLCCLAGRGATCTVQLAKWASPQPTQITGATTVDDILAQYLAVKVVEQPSDADAAEDRARRSIATRRLQHEQSLLAQLDHPGVAKVSVMRDNTRRVSAAVWLP